MMKILLLATSLLSLTSLTGCIENVPDISGTYLEEKEQVKYNYIFEKIASGKFKQVKVGFWKKDGSIDYESTQIYQYKKGSRNKFCKKSSTEGILTECLTYDKVKGIRLDGYSNFFPKSD